MSEEEELVARLVAVTKAWCLAYDAIGNGVSDQEYADADIEFMGEAQDLGGQLLALEDDATPNPAERDTSVETRQTAGV